MRKLSAKWVPKCLNADQKRQRCQSSEQILEFFLRDTNYFLSRLVTMDETWLYHYDPDTKQQSMEWQHSGSPNPAPKNSESKNPLEKFSLCFLGSRRHPPHWLSSKGPNYQSGVLLISAGVIEGHFEGKTPRENHQVCLVLARQCPVSPGTCNPERNWPTWASNVLITHPILRIWSLRNTPCSLDWKNDWKIAILHPTRRSLLPRRPGWKENFLNFFFEKLSKVRATK